MQGSNPSCHNKDYWSWLCGGLLRPGWSTEGGGEGGSLEHSWLGVAGLGILHRVLVLAEHAVAMGVGLGVRWAIEK